MQINLLFIKVVIISLSLKTLFAINRRCALYKYVTVSDIKINKNFIYQSIFLFNGRHGTYYILDFLGFIQFQYPRD